MKYYSEVTKKVYDTVNELKTAELEIVDKANVRKKDAEKVEKAFNDYKTARLNYEQALKEFCDKHGAYHRTIKNTDENTEQEFNSLRELVNLLF